MRKTIGLVALSFLLLSTASCSEKQVSEEDKPVVGIEKGVASPNWNSDGEIMVEGEQQNAMENEVEPVENESDAHETPSVAQEE